jgi:adenylate cyclase
MRYDGLTEAYWKQQINHIERVRAKIAARAAATSPGRLIPDDTDLVIGTGRRVAVAVLFLDISSFSRRQSITVAEQEMMLRVLNLFFTEMIRIIEDHGGYVEKNTGDGLMAYFEPVLGGEVGAVQRAVASALTMEAANEFLICPVLRASGVDPLKFRITIEHGPVTVARIGAAQRFNANVAIGNAANFAAKMLGLIEADQIALGAAARAQLPIEWQILWTEQAQVNTGWVYGDSNVPYPLFLYTGRWAKLV